MRLPRNLHFEVKRSDPLRLSRKLDHENMRFPVRLPRKETTVSENARGATTKAELQQAPVATSARRGRPRFREPVRRRFREA